MFRLHFIVFDIINIGDGIRIFYYLRLLYQMSKYIFKRKQCKNRRLLHCLDSNNFSLFSWRENDSSQKSKRIRRRCITIFVSRGWRYAHFLLAPLASEDGVLLETMNVIYQYRRRPLRWSCPEVPSPWGSDLATSSLSLVPWSWLYRRHLYQTNWTPRGILIRFVKKKCEQWPNYCNKLQFLKMSWLFLGY